MKSYISHESYYNCNCGCAVAKLTQYNDDNVAEPQVEFAIFPMFPKYRNWKLQIKWIWHIITKQCVWDDQIMLGTDEMERLGTQLLNLAKRIKEDNFKEVDNSLDRMVE